MGADIAKIAFLVSQGALEEAWLRIREENPFPAVCGRVCPRFCEAACNRGSFDKPVSFGSLERYMADHARNTGLTPPQVVVPPTGKRVAVVGAGPAGLTAAHYLRRLGHGVDLFDPREEPGGMLRYSIPEFRLPIDVLDWEINLLLSTGVRFLPGHRFGENLGWEDLAGYDAVFLALGAWTPVPLDIAGQELSRDGLTLLNSVRRGERPHIRGPVAVIGGGNTSIDVARTLLRLGATPTIYYRRRLGDMPASPAEIDEAMKEGIPIQTLLAPCRIEPAVGGGLRLTLNPMEIVEDATGGRGRLIPSDTSSVQIEVSAVFTAIGTNPSSGLPEEAKGSSRPRMAGGNIFRIHPGGWSIDSPVFLGGDLIADRRTVVAAIASGKKAAVVIDAELRGLHPTEVLPSIRVGSQGALSWNLLVQGDRTHRRNHVVLYEEINRDYFHKGKRSDDPHRDPTIRRADFEEVKQPLSGKVANKEANRCFRCGICDDCDNCNLFCPDVAVIRGLGDKGREIAYDYCKGCGVCVSECPRNAMVLEEEPR